MYQEPGVDNFDYNWNLWYILSSIYAVSNYLHENLFELFGIEYN